jgi:hypothetical protein
MPLSELFKLVCSCLIIDEYPEITESIKDKFISGEVDLFEFIHLCSDHLVLPAIYRNLQNAGLMEHFPSDFADHLNDIYQLNLKRNKDIIQQIDAINNQLNTENTELIFLKGTANLLDNVYSDPGDRMIGDIDFLVKEQDYLKTANLLMRLGYKHSSKIYWDINTAKDYPRLFKKDVPADIEIHRMPVDVKYSGQFNTELLFQNKKIIEGRKNSFVCSDEHKLIHTFIHSQLSNKGCQYNIVSIRDLYDAYLLSKKVDIESVLSKVEEKKKARIFFEYTSYLFNPGINDKTSTIKIPNKYALRHEWYLNHPKWHRRYFTLLKLYELIFNRYLLVILKAPFQKNSMHYIYLKLKDPDWYKEHFSDIKKTFFS